MSLAEAIVLYLLLASVVWSLCSIWCWDMGQRHQSQRMRWMFVHFVLCVLFITFTPRGFTYFLQYLG